MKVKKCDSLQEIRSEIDEVDERIIELIAHRKNYVAQAAKFKHSVAEIKADDRIEDVLNHVRHKALTLGLSPNLVIELFSRMIHDMVETEISEFRNAKNF